MNKEKIKRPFQIKKLILHSSFTPILASISLIGGDATDTNLNLRYCKDSVRFPLSIAFKRIQNSVFDRFPEIP